MRGSELLDKMELVDPAYVQAADGLIRSTRRRRVGRAAVAACLCIAAACAFFVFQHTKTLSPALIAENIKDLEELISLCGDTLQYGDTAVSLYQDDPTPEFAYRYRAAFEYEGVFYHLSTQSNDPNRICIFELLDSVLSGSSAVRTEETPQTFASILGFSDYHVSVEESTPGFYIWHYYAEVDGETQCIAKMSGYVYADGGPEAYSIDLDGDSVTELVCNTIYGTGAERVSVFRNNNGVIEEGVIKEKSLETQFHMSLMWGSGSISERYDSAQNAFVVTGPDEDGNPMTISFSYDLEYFYFYPFESLP